MYNKILKKTTNFPKEFLDSIKIESYKDEVIIYNYEKILELTKDTINFKLLSIVGNNIKIKYLSRNKIIIKGLINKIEFKHINENKN